MPKNEKAIMNVMMDRAGYILDKSIRNALKSENPRFEVNFPANIVEDLIISLKSRKFSILTLVVSDQGLNFEELK